MISIYVTNSTFVHKSNFETINQIIACLQNKSSGAQQIRHSLKNLCFLQPSPIILPSLIDLLIKNIFQQSNYFKLLCFHLVNHSRFLRSISKPNQLFETIESVLLNKKQIKYSYLILRVYYYFSLHLPNPNLSFTFTHILSADITRINEKRRKSLMKLDMNIPIIELIHEAISLLPSLPLPHSTIVSILTNEMVIKGILTDFIAFEKEWKIRILTSLTPIIVPEILFELLPTTFSDIFQFQIVDFIVLNSDKFDRHIKQALSSHKIPKPETFSLLEFLIASKKYNEYSQILLSSVLSSIINDNASSGDLCTALKILERNPNYSLPQITSFSLFHICNSNDPTKSSFAFSCLSLISDEIEWLQNELETLLSRYSFVFKQSLVSLLLSAWTNSMNFTNMLPQSVFPLLIILLKNSELIDTNLFNCFLMEIIRSKKIKEMLKQTKEVLDGRPTAETVILMAQAGATFQKEVDVKNEEESIDFDDLGLSDFILRIRNISMSIGNGLDFICNIMFEK